MTYIRTKLGTLIICCIFVGTYSSNAQCDTTYYISESLCAGDTTEFTVLAETYMWSTGDTIASISITEPGIYSVTATDSIGCEFVVELTVVLTEFPVIIIPPPTMCQGESVEFCLPNGFSIYDPETGALTDCIQIDSADLYCLLVEYQGCQEEVCFFIDVIISPEPVIIGDDILCPGESLMLDAGPGYLAYMWSNGATTWSIEVDAPGAYMVTVTDDLGCTGTDQITIHEGPVNHWNFDFELCPGQTECIVKPDEILSWTGWPGGQTGDTACVSLADWPFSVEVDDGSVCGAVATIQIAENVPELGNIDLSHCPGDSVFVFGQWYFSTGTYLDTVPGAASNGCDSIYTVTITEKINELVRQEEYLCYPESGNDGTAYVEVYADTIFAPGEECDSILEISIFYGGALGPAQVNVIPDPGTGKGSITINGMTGGFGPYTFVWSNGNTGPSATGLSPGTYSVTITDAIGCDTVYTFAVPAKPPVRPEAEPPVLEVFPNPLQSDVTIVLSSLRGNAPKIRIVDMHGRVVAQEVVFHDGHHTIAVSGPPGIYFVYVISEHATLAVERLIKVD